MLFLPCTKMGPWGVQSIFKGGSRNWQGKLSKDKNKRPWTSVSWKIITACWFWVEERWTETFFSDGVCKGSSCLHSRVYDFLLSWTCRRQPVGLKGGGKGWLHPKHRERLNTLSSMDGIHPFSSLLPPDTPPKRCPYPLPTILNLLVFLVTSFTLLSHLRKNAARVPVLNKTWKWLRIYMKEVIICQSSTVIESSSQEIWRYP